METEKFPILKYTVQLYYAPIKENAALYLDHNPPIQIASGVLVKYASKFLLITCKHVFDGIKPEDVIILTRAGFAVRLPNDIKFINDENNSIDLAVITLKGHRLKELKSCYSFLPHKNIGFKHNFDEELYYMLFGFVNSKTTLNDFEFYAQPFGYLTNIRSYKNFEKMGFSYNNNITLEYNRRKQSDLNDEVRQIGYNDLKGMSGGGVWLSVEGKKPNTYEYILVAIMIEQRISRGFIIATKIDFIEVNNTAI